MNRKMTDAQLDYERKRAAKANKSLDEWLKAKAKAVLNANPAKPDITKKPGLLRRLVDRGHKPIASKK
jgi:hypothetical protein